MLYYLCIIYYPTILLQNWMFLRHWCLTSHPQYPWKNLQLSIEHLSFPKLDLKNYFCSNKFGVTQRKAMLTNTIEPCSINQDHPSSFQVIENWLYVSHISFCYRCVHNHCVLYNIWPFFFKSFSDNCTLWMEVSERTFFDLLIDQYHLIESERDISQSKPQMSFKAGKGRASD